MKKTEIAHARLLELVHYEPSTGIFTWRIKPARRIVVGSRVGYINNDGYRAMKIEGRMYRANRLAVFYMTGEWPDASAHVDHQFGDRADDRWDVLREITPRGNYENQRRPHRDNKTGVQGVIERKGRFSAYIGVDRRTKCLGTFASAAEAHAVYLDAKRHLHGGNTL